MPSSQLLGSGFGQSGSTSNIGACHARCASALLLQHRLADAERDDAAPPAPIAETSLRLNDRHEFLMDALRETDPPVACLAMPAVIIGEFRGPCKAAASSPNVD